MRRGCQSDYSDASNPRGYLEFEAVKRLKSDRSWLPQARVYAVKIIHLLLPELVHASTEIPFRITLMRRPMEEVLASQRAMLGRQGRAAATLPDAQLGALFADQLERAERLLSGRLEFRICSIDYPVLMANPQVEMARTNAFSDGKLDAEAMARVVDPALYRERATRRVE